MFKNVMLFVLAAMLLSSVAFAQDDMGMKGKTELSFAAAWADIAESDLTIVGVNAGHFFTPNWQAGLGALYLDLDGEDAWALAPFVAYNFINESTTNMVPYVGVGYYFIDIEDDNESGFEAFAGARFFVGGDYKCANRAFFLEYRYLNDVADENVSTVMAGITNFF